MHREAFLARVRSATGGRPPETPPELPAPGGASARADLVERLAHRWPRPQAFWYHVAATHAGRTIETVLRERGVRRVALSRHPLLAHLQIAAVLEEMAIDAVRLERAEDVHGVLAACDAGITVAAHVVAETGTLVERASPQQPRALSLLPPVHIALAPEAHLLGTLDDLFTLLGGERLESGVALISGPSGTADIGLRHVVGVHGPREVHLILVRDLPAEQDRAEPGPPPHLRRPG